MSALTVPLSRLPRLPVGAPLVDNSTIRCIGRCTLTHWREPEEDGEQVLSVCELETGKTHYYELALHYALNLSNPHGKRVDGLEVGLRILGWEPGVWLMHGLLTNGNYFLDIGDDHKRHETCAKIDPQHPDALRLAVCAALWALGSK